MSSSSESGGESLSRESSRSRKLISYSINQSDKKSVKEVRDLDIESVKNVNVLRSGTKKKRKRSDKDVLKVKGRFTHNVVEKYLDNMMESVVKNHKICLEENNSILILMNRMHIYFDENEYELYLSKSEAFLRLIKVIKFSSMKFKQMSEEKKSSLDLLLGEISSVENKALDSYQDFVKKHKKDGKKEKKSPEVEVMSYEKEKLMFLQSGIDPLHSDDRELKQIIENASKRVSSSRPPLEKKDKGGSLLVKRKVNRRRRNLSKEESESETGDEGYYDIKSKADPPSRLASGKKQIANRADDVSAKGVGLSKEDDKFLEDKKRKKKGKSSPAIKRTVLRANKRRDRYKRRSVRKVNVDRKGVSKASKRKSRQPKKKSSESDKLDVNKFLEKWQKSNKGQKEIEEVNLISPKTTLNPENFIPGLSPMLPEFIQKNEKKPIEFTPSPIPTFKPLNINQKNTPNPPINLQEPSFTINEQIEVENLILTGNIEIPNLIKSHSMPPQQKSKPAIGFSKIRATKKKTTNEILSGKDEKIAKTKLNKILRDRFKLKRRDLENFSNDIMVKFANRKYYNSEEKLKYSDNVDLLINHFVSQTSNPICRIRSRIMS